MISNFSFPFTAEIAEPAEKNLKSEQKNSSIFRFHPKLCVLCVLGGEIPYLNKLKALRAITIRWISEVPVEAIKFSASR